jgi:hypothetical protein
MIVVSLIWRNCVITGMLVAGCARQVVVCVICGTLVSKGCMICEVLDSKDCCLNTFMIWHHIF